MEAAAANSSSSGGAGGDSPPVGENDPGTGTVARVEVALRGRADGPDANGAGTDGADANDRGTQNADTGGPGTNEPVADEPGVNAVGADEPGATGSGTDEPGANGAGADRTGTGEGRKASGGRAGRNLPAAIAVGIGLGGITLASLYTVKVLFLLVVAAAVGVGIVELARAFATRGIQVQVVPLLGGMATMVVGTYWGGPIFLVGSFTLTLMITLAWRMFAPPGDAKGVVAGTAGYVRDASASALILAYPALIAGFVPLLLAEDDGAHRVVVFIAVTICSDIGGYVAGVLFGKHKMSPIISPKKTWEGFAGSALACVICGALLVRFLIDGQLWQGAFLGAVVVVFATLGDLIESVIKRDLGIKDMGTLLPGHGGLMDRLDSLLFTVVPVWLLLHLFG